jgi:photosystem II stability/assembly factor-like uncharacterized protein
MKSIKHRHTFLYCVLFGMTISVSAQTWTPQTPPSTQTLRSVFFINSNDGWAAGYDGIIHTNNSGSTWSTQLSGSPYRLLAVRFLDANYGWANAGLKIFRTENGGSTWNDMTGIDPNAIIFRNVIFPVSPNVAWATAQGGGLRWFYRYTATSQTVVTEQTFGLISSSVALYDLWFVDENNGWAVGLSGQIWKISNASSESPGFTNQTNTSVTSLTLRGVFFLDANNGWAVGDGGTIIKTTNGGTNWSLLTSGSTTNLKDVFFKDTNIGFAVGESGLILATTDGGNNWSAQTCGVTTTLWSVIFVGLAPGFIVGGDLSTSANGAILRTDNPLLVKEESEISNSFSLDQNFPNPFSTTTEIRFYVPHNDFVSLKVYDAAGRQVAVLVNEQLPPGHYSRAFSANRIHGGMYFYCLRASGFVQMKKFLLQK